MRVSYTKISSTQHTLQVEIEALEFDKYIDKAASSVSHNLDIQGFRKGHAPRDMVERYAGSDKLYNEAAEIAVRASYAEALNSEEGHKLKEATYELEVPEIQVTKLAPNNSFIYKAIFTVPVFELAKDYGSIAARVRKNEFKEVGVSDGEVEDTLKWLVKSRKGEVSDEFAKSLGNFQNLEELKKSVGEGILMEKKKKEKERVRLAIIKEIILKSKKDIPDKIIELEISRIEDEFKESVGEMGLDFDEYLVKISAKGGSASGGKKKELRAGWQDQARERVEISSALGAIAREENINPTEDEVKLEAAKVLGRYKNVKDAKKDYDPEALRGYVTRVLRNQRVFEFLESSN
jgi:FKBP-type peptidyl-prolyl cis-trans isomerase (trigger factor)